MSGPPAGGGDRGATAPASHELVVCRSPGELDHCLQAMLAAGETLVVAGGRIQPMLAASGFEPQNVIDVDETSIHPWGVLGAVGKRLESGPGVAPAAAPPTVVTAVTPRTPSGWSNWALVESILNVALARSGVDARCLVDATALPGDALDLLCAAHPRLDGASGSTRTQPFLQPASFVTKYCPQQALIDSRTEPDRTLDAVCDVVSTRRALVQLGEGHLGTDVLKSFEVVLAELVTNALVHGRGEVTVRLWRTDAGVVVAVSDEGPGPSDPIVGMVPPQRGSTGGFGLWLARNWSDVLSVVREPSGCTVWASVGGGDRDPSGHRSR